MTKMENIQKRNLRFVLDDFESDYETLLDKPNKCTTQVGRPHETGIISIFCFKY